MEVTKPQIQQVKQCRFEQIYAYLPFFYALCTLCPFFYCIDLFPVIGSIRFEQFCFSAGGLLRRRCLDGVVDSLGIFSRGGNGSRKESLLFLLGCLEAQGSFPAKIQGGVVSTRLGIAPVYFFPKMVRPYGKLILRPAVR